MSSTISLRIPHTLIGMGSSREIASIIGEYKAQKILIITDKNIVKAGLIDNVKASLEEEGYTYDVFDNCQPDAPSSSVEECSSFARNGSYDLLIGVGGGSSMDTTKAVSVLAPNTITFSDLVEGKEIEKTLPIILVPTTSGTGSEWDEGAVFTDEAVDQKRWIKNSRFLARGAVIDPELTLKLPGKVTADTGMDALSHAIESYISPGATIFSDILAETAMRLIAENLPLAFKGGSRAVDARYKMSIAAAMAMKATILAGSSLGHAINNEITVKAHVTHGVSVLIVLPHVMLFEMEAVPNRFVRMAECMGVPTAGLSQKEAAHKAIDTVRQMSKDLGMPQTLREVGITEADIPLFVENLVKYRFQLIKARSLRSVSEDDLLQLFKAAL